MSVSSPSVQMQLESTVRPWPKKTQGNRHKSQFSQYLSNLWRVHELFLFLLYTPVILGRFVFVKSIPGLQLTFPPARTPTRPFFVQFISNASLDSYPTIGTFLVMWFGSGRLNLHPKRSAVVWKHYVLTGYCFVSPRLNKQTDKIHTYSYHVPL